MAQATIRDVAREAGVSVASVSRALNGHKSVRSKTRSHVVAVADRLGYVPHAGARSLSMARSNAIGVVLPDLHGEFFSQIVRGMDREASRLGLQLLLSNMHADPVQAIQALRAMRGRVDGLLIMSPQMRADGWSSAVPRGLPAVLINSSDDDGNHPALRMDNRAGAAAVARHFSETGRRTIACIAGPDHNVDARERQEGFAEAVAREMSDAALTVIPGDFTEESGEAAARHILARDLPVDAIFAANDMMALGCLQTLRDAGRRVPEEIAIAGFDDVPVARYLGLTTIRVGIARIGARAVARLAAMMDGESADGPLIEWHQPELIVRGTSQSSRSWRQRY